MGVSLQKGQQISLTKQTPALTKVMCGLGWDVAHYSKGGYQYDLDSSVICLSAEGELTTSKNIIYFSNLRHQSNAIVHQGDSLTGGAEGDDEIVIVDLPKVPSDIARLVFAVNIYRCVVRQQDFSEVKNAFVRLVDVSDKQELARYDLSGKEYTGMTGMILAEIYRENHEWKMKAVGDGFKADDLEEIVKTKFKFKKYSSLYFY